MKKMTKLERVLAAFKHQETDRVPLYDLMLNDDCIEYFTGVYAPYDEAGAKAQAQAVDRMLDMARGVGAAPLRPSEQLLNSTDDPDLIEYARFSGTRHEHEPFASYAAAVAWLKAQNSALSKWRTNTDLKEEAANTRRGFERLYGWMGEDHVICCLRQSGVGLDDIRARIGLEFFSYICADEPGLVTEYMELATEREVAIIHANADPHISPWALTYGDIAMKGTLLHSPEWLRREFFPRLKLLNDAYHEHGIICLFHSDGYLMEIMDDLIAAGIDGLNPMETVAGMDVAEVYRRYGDKIFLTGGIDMSQLLSNGTPDQVRAVCRKAIANAPRGYFMGSTTEIDNSSRLENVLAMMEVAWGHKPEGAHPDILRQIEQRKARLRKEFPQWLEQQRREAFFLQTRARDLQTQLRDELATYVRNPQDADKIVRQYEIMDQFRTIVELPLKWKFKPDPENSGEQEKIYERPPDDAWKDILVTQSWTAQEWNYYHGAAWYSIAFKSPAFDAEGKVYLQFGAVDGVCKVWVDGAFVGFQERSPEEMWDRRFALEVTGLIKPGHTHRVTVKVFKQNYSAGIWKPVELKKTKWSHYEHA